MAWSNTKVAAAGSALALSMLALAFASDPLYDAFCRVTGFGGTTRVADAAPATILDRTINVRFDANVADVPILFRALTPETEIKIGQHALAFYEVTNTSSKPVSVIATYNVTPHYSGPYFNKLECFCFDERVIQAGETKKLPVVYFIAPEIVEDRVATDLETITLSYTFFDSGDYDGSNTTGSAGAANSASDR